MPEKTGSADTPGDSAPSARTSRTSKASEDEPRSAQQEARERDTEREQAQVDLNAKRAEQRNAGKPMAEIVADEQAEAAKRQRDATRDAAKDAR